MITYANQINICISYKIKAVINSAQTPDIYCNQV